MRNRKITGSNPVKPIIMISDEKYLEMLKEHVDTVCNCKHLSQNIEFESCWMDCTHPERPALSCPYRKMSECRISTPDTLAQEIQIGVSMNSKHFWDDHKAQDKYRSHICDHPLEELQVRHKHVLALIPEHDPVIIGLLLAGKYYLDVWSSRSCSGYLAKLVGCADYMTFYCSSSAYYHLSKSNRTVLAFTEADRLDSGEQNNV